MKPKVGKCAWCGRELTFTKDGYRLKQHSNAGKTCVGSGQPWAVHKSIHERRTKS